MKKLLYTLLVCVGVSSLSFGQEANETAISQGATELAESKRDGVFEFTMPETVSKDDVAKNADYYAHYFEAGFDSGNHVATLKMVENTGRNRMVIARFLIASGVHYVTVDDKNMTVNDFMGSYLK